MQNKLDGAAQALQLCPWYDEPLTHPCFAPRLIWWSGLAAKADFATVDCRRVIHDPVYAACRTRRVAGNA